MQKSKLTKMSFNITNKINICHLKIDNEIQKEVSLHEL